MNVDFGAQFSKNYKNFPRGDRDKISCFIAHVKEHGFCNLEGLNKESHYVNKEHPRFRELVCYALKYCLWHYHIGIKTYDSEKLYGVRTSEYVLHYIKGDDCIKIVDFSRHPPFELPSEDYLH